MNYATKKDYVIDQMLRPYQEAKNDEKRLEIVKYIIWKYVEQTDWVSAYADYVGEKTNALDVVRKFQEHNNTSYWEFKDVLSRDDE